MSSIPAYRYSPLAPGEVRLLQLLPRNWNLTHDPIRLNIVNTTFDRCHVPDSFFSYEALSYVWGGERTQTVYCDGQSIPATPNLVSALSRLRIGMDTFPYFHRTLWVDAICINQEDLEERSNQVKLMRDIYSRASKVLLWLGNNEELVSKVAEVIRGTSPYMDMVSRLERNYLEEWADVVLPIFDQAWFQRVWVIQEVVFSVKTLVIAGGIDITWRSLVSTAAMCLRFANLSPERRYRCQALVGIDGLRKKVRPDGGTEIGTVTGIHSSHPRATLT
jgi:hypothetical protein